MIVDVTGSRPVEQRGAPEALDHRPGVVAVLTAEDIAEAKFSIRGVLE